MLAEFSIANYNFSVDYHKQSKCVVVSFVIIYLPMGEFFSLCCPKADVKRGRELLSDSAWVRMDLNYVAYGETPKTPAITKLELGIYYGCCSVAIPKDHNSSIGIFKIALNFHHHTTPLKVQSDESASGFNYFSIKSQCGLNTADYQRRIRNMLKF